MKRLSQIAMLGLCMVLCIALLVSLLFVSTLLHHHCTGDCCPTCVYVQVCQRLLHGLCGIGILSFFLSMKGEDTRPAIPSSLSFSFRSNPVFLKTKLTI